MPELRPYLKRVHKLELPPRAQGGFGADQDGHRAGFLVFLDFVKRGKFRAATDVCPV